MGVGSQLRPTHRVYQTASLGDFPNVVKNRLYNAEDVGSMPGLETKIPHTMGQLSVCATATEFACCQREAYNERSHPPQPRSLAPPPRLCSGAKLCLSLCDPIDCSPPGSSVHEIFQARILEWVAIPFSRGSSQPGNRTPGLLHCRQILYHLSHQGAI